MQHQWRLGRDNSHSKPVLHNLYIHWAFLFVFLSTLINLRTSELIRTKFIVFSLTPGKLMFMASRNLKFFQKMHRYNLLEIYQ